MEEEIKAHSLALQTLEEAAIVAKLEREKENEADRAAHQVCARGSRYGGVATPRGGSKLGICRLDASNPVSDI
jgi:hypothetical protein